MPTLAIFAACLTVMMTAATAQAAVGFTIRQVPDGTNPPIETGIWYPTDAPAQATPVSLFTQTVARDAMPRGHALPLIVMSHGTGGEFSGHGDTAYALAEAGFVVASPTYTGDNYRDQSRATDIRFRVQQFMTVTDYMVQVWQPGAIDARRIGAFGFSAGGLTVLIAAGGEPDLTRIGPYCAAHATVFVCRMVAEHHTVAPAPGALILPFPHETRLRAIVVAAPAMGFTLTPDRLRTVTVPVQLWRADADAILPAPYYADAVRAALPAPPDFHAVPDAGHFDFLAPCSAALAKVAPAICGSAPGFDRGAFHAAFDKEVVGFFLRNLGT
jgi:predicted dienelactone hydrolase